MALNTKRVAAKSAAQKRADAAIIRQALRLLEERMHYNDPPLIGPQAVSDYLRLRMAELEHEVFWALWLDAGSRLIEVEELFRGTLTQVSVHPREVAKSALRVNAASVILAHNHPSGRAAPSSGDIALTDTLRSALMLFEVHVLDHIIVGGVGEPHSMAMSGEMGGYRAGQEQAQKRSTARPPAQRRQR